MQGVAALDQRCRDLLAPTDDIEGQTRAAAALGALGRPLLALRDHDLVLYKLCLVDTAFGALHR